MRSQRPGLAQRTGSVACRELRGWSNRLVGEDPFSNGTLEPLGKGLAGARWGRSGGAGDWPGLVVLGVYLREPLRKPQLLWEGRGPSELRTSRSGVSCSLTAPTLSKEAPPLVGRGPLDPNQSDSLSDP